MRSHFSAVLGVIAAAVWTASTAVPASPSGPADPCALERVEVHHSEGVSTWNRSYPRPLGRVDVALIFLSFPDSVPRLSTAQLAADHIPDTRRFFANASYGMLDLRLVPIPGYIPMPSPSSAYAIARDWDPEPRRRYLQDAVRAADPRVDFSRYRAVFFVADPNAPGVQPDATKVVNLTRPLTADGVRLAHIGAIFEAHPPDPYVFAHETGHIFDLPDLYRRPDTDDRSGEWNAEVGDWDLMGDQKGLAPDPFAWHKWKFGWLQPHQVLCLSRPGTLRTSLTPVEIPGGRKLLVIPVDRERAYAVEVRGRHGNDAAACRSGVLVYEIRASVRSGDGPVRIVDAHPLTSSCRGRSAHPPLADAPFAVGEEFRDPATETAVRVVAEGGTGGYTIEATRGH